MLNIYLKPNWFMILFSNSVPLSVCRVVGALKIAIHFWTYLVYFCRFILQQDYSSIFDKRYSIVKVIWIHLAFHVRIELNISVRTVIMEANTSAVFLFLFFCLIKMSHWTFHYSLRFALDSFLVPLTKQI